MQRILFTGLILICLLPGTNAQDKNLFKKNFLDAEYFFMTEEYREALHLYLELLKTDPDNANLQFLVGACYLSLYGEKNKAIPYLEKAVENMSPAYREGSYKERAAPREAIFALARAYHINEDFDLAIKEYGKYRDVMIKRNFADIEYVNNQIKSCERAKSMVMHPVEIQFIRLDDEVNRFQSNYNPVVSYDDTTFIYVTDRPLYHAIVMTRRKPGGGWTDPRLINGELGSDGDCYPTSLTANGKELYLVKKDAYGSDIYISYLKNGHWTKMVPLNRKINTDYAETHACISYNGKMLYFTSDRPGGEGALDIWVSETNEEGDWGEPRNLGPKINTHYSEETPFLADLGKKLYFSSQGHATMGGFDYFVAQRLPTMTLGREAGSGKKSEAVPFDAGWSFPENLGYPISTADDDLFYYPRRIGQGAYVSEIREDINPDRSIYALRPKVEPLEIAARKRDRDKETESVTTGTTVESGLTQASAGGGSGTVSGTETPPPGETDPDDYYVLNNILFGFDSSELNEKAREEADRVFEVMTRNPRIELELTGHTDAVGTDEYNLRLSERRAQSVADYLVGKGIRKSRIKVTAAGETHPIALNRYEDGTDSPQGRQLNRHVSVKLENLRDEKVRVAEIFVPENLRPKFDQSFTVLLVNSSVMLDTIPDVVAGEQTALIITDSAFLYTAGNFSEKVHAMQYLNEVIDAGYPNAGMLEERDLERLISRLSAEGISVTASFTIQIMALKNPVEISYFKPLEGVVMYRGKDGLHRYVYGDFPNVREAIQRLPSIRQMGYEDAFIMSILRYRKLSE
jgi:outer membrane protein OmpA-like peptidoglycan-associated protein/tetratricopeptide (TPR) repeat protein